MILIFKIIRNYNFIEYLYEVEDCGLIILDNNQTTNYLYIYNFIFNLSYPYKTEELLFQEVYTDANTKYKLDRR